MDEKLFVAARTGNVATLHNLPENNPADGEKALPESSKWTPLHIACLSGKVDFAREFLRRRPQFLKHENPDGCTALHLASSSGHFNMVEFLLSRGHDRVLCMKKDQDGRNPLHHAVIKGSVEVVRKLLEACPESALEVTVHRETVYHLAVKNRVSVSDELFLELLGGPYTEYLLNLADKKGNTVLHLTSVRKQTRIISLLTEWRPMLEVNAVNSVGLRRPSLDVNTVRSTVAPRPSLDVNAVNSSGLTPLDLLVVDPINFTDMKIEGIIKSKDGIRLNESQEQREHLKSIASGLLVMASLTAATSCQIAVFLKGGFGENSSAPVGNVTSISSNATAAIQKLGNATLLNQHGADPTSLPYLLVPVDGVTFLLSLCLISFVLFPTSNNNSIRFKWLCLRFLTYASTLSLGVLVWKLVLARENKEIQAILSWVSLPFFSIILVLNEVPLIRAMVCHKIIRWQELYVRGLQLGSWLGRWWNQR
ncbi:LOW QUALITY PROTEIN: ankyrin repeat-containing protein BDA1 [Hevea brasiliensis]|uniref:LOW QUALITY PROTEIN: ankyrin repeat-containing protein BDA1 n=1 Tax=Hevea brasiliensis TaxID=3981 RepID=UPI0025E3ADAE|nr:LOW QUALITY PROTEIN: ankyrin repeat-containing protein BDA1 [Hevea brasiliensis]